MPSSPARRHASFLEPNAEGSEQVSSPAALSGSVNDNDRLRPKRTRLTRENLALLDKMIKGKWVGKVSEEGQGSTVDSPRTSTSTTMSGFALQAQQNGILDLAGSKPPINLDEIRHRLARSRETPSPTESAFDDYRYTVSRVCNEATMVFEVGGKLLKEYPNEGYKRAFSQVLTAIPTDAAFNKGLSAPQPDFVEGLHRQEYRLLPMERIGGAVHFKDDPPSLTLSHLAGEWKGRGKDMEKARLQSAYDGTALVYARNQALSLVRKPDLASHANVITFTTDGTTINFFAHYAALAEEENEDEEGEGRLEYHQYPIASTNLINSCQELKQGRRQLRNAQDHARERSYALRDQLKEHRKQRTRGGVERGVKRGGVEGCGGGAAAERAALLDAADKARLPRASSLRRSARVAARQVSMETRNG